MRSKGINTQTELIELIEKHFGFKKERIENPTKHGLWYVQFEVNGIKYAGAINFHGALPTLKIMGYTTTHYYHETPIEDWYYDQFINGRPVQILKRTDLESGDWVDTGIRCLNQEEAKMRISHMSNPSDYWYDIVD